MQLNRKTEGQKEKQINIIRQKTFKILIGERNLVKK